MHEVLADEAALDHRVAAVLDELLGAGPTAVRAAKAIIRTQRGMSTAEKRSLTVGAIARQRVSPEGQEGLSALPGQASRRLARLTRHAKVASTDATIAT